MGEKTGWTYVTVSEAQAQKLKKGNKKSFRVKGKLDNYAVKELALIPMGDGSFIIPLKADVRKALGKKAGAELKVKIEEDITEFIPDSDFEDSLAFEPAANNFFKTLTKGHQRYFSNWIQSAKTETTKAKRIALAVNALARKMDYGAMIREQVAENKLLGRL